jgi:hypothetical protein
MSKIDEIRSRRLSHNDIAKINAMAEVSEPGPEIEDLEDKLPVLNELETKTKEKPAVNDVAFYGPRVMEFYRYFLDGNAPGIAVQMALAACTLKASVVIGQAVNDLKGIYGLNTPAIPVKATVPAIPGRKRGRPVGSKKKNA